MNQLFPFVKKHFIYPFLFICLLADVCFSYYQYSLSTIDGDLPSIVAPSHAYEHLFKDPFGIEVLKTGEMSAAPNRYFAHITIYYYFRYVPLWLQNFMSPIDSLYTSAALAKTLIQISVIALLAAYISLIFGSRTKEFILIAVFISPLFQAVGNFEYMAFIDNCITYAMFYALPSALLLLFLFPFYKKALTGKSGLPMFIQPIWLILAVILAFNGPLPTPVFLILCPSILFGCWFFNFKKYKTLPIAKRVWHAMKAIHWKLFLSFSFVVILCLYSFYIGTYNYENLWTPMPLSDRYIRLLQGTAYFFRNLRPLFLAILFNVIILFTFKDGSAKKLMSILGLLLLFSAVYIAMLPFGGYREYRPYIIRRDTIQPVLLIMFFAWGASSLFILKNTVSMKRNLYCCFIAFVCFFYTWRDPLPVNTNECERHSLEQIAKFNGDCIELKDDCTVLQWNKETNCDLSIYPAAMLKYWNVTSREVRYYHEPTIKKH